MKEVRFLKEAPPWFNLADYDYLSELGAGGWGFVLSRIYHYESNGDFESWVRDHKAKALRQGATFIEKDGILGEEPDEDYYYKNALFRPVGLAEILHGTLQDVPLDTKDLLLIDRRLPLATKIALFARWCEQSTVTEDLPGLKPGKGILNSKFGQAKFDSWVEKRIVPYFDLTFWAKHDAVKFTSDVLFNLLFPDEPADSKTDPKDRIDYIPRVLNKALKAREALRAQAIAEST